MFGKRDGDGKKSLAREVNIYHSGQLRIFTLISGQRAICIVELSESLSSSRLREIRKLSGFRDEPLKGKRTGQRSIRLSGEQIGQRIGQDCRLFQDHNLKTFWEF